MGKYTETKKVTLDYFEAMEKCSPEEVKDVMKKHMADNYDFKGVYPFRQQYGIDDVAEKFWIPLKKSLLHMRRRQDIFIGGENMYAPEEKWTMSMGHFMGLFDNDWLGIRHTRKIAMLRYVEFTCVENGKITKSGLFLDIIGLMQQAGMYPLPPSTGHYFVYPGPRNHNGLLFDDAHESEGQKTLDIINQFTIDLQSYNDKPNVPFDCYRNTWHEDMVWYGPCGIGATYTVERYFEQHQNPFTYGLDDMKFNGHVVRFAEGPFACFFGWPNLTNRPIGGYMGLPASNIADMQVVDVYSREDDKLAENWVFIDNVYWMKQQGVDILGRTEQILNK
ncbi:nuclear transport factor 2 family protein [Clostridium sediminicola]|uniref:hypothetical protein n=1 Tax=Clostridium sediminicola TaxID=3114879 RepID=UPI0031F211D8